jgi:hypothetical protein
VAAAVTAVAGATMAFLVTEVVPPVLADDPEHERHKLNCNVRALYDLNH